jgi:hypothetical protein
MIGALRQRGPDAEHSVSWTADLKPTEDPAPNALLHTRLSIIDPRPIADQPMSNAAGDVWISYNGEVYDWAADAKVLTDAGTRFAPTRTPIHPMPMSIGASISSRVSAACLHWPSAISSAVRCSSFAIGWA